MRIQDFIILYPWKARLKRSSWIKSVRSWSEKCCICSPWHYNHATSFLSILVGLLKEKGFRSIGWQHWQPIERRQHSLATSSILGWHMYHKSCLNTLWLCCLALGPSLALYSALSVAQKNLQSLSHFCALFPISWHVCCFAVWNRSNLSSSLFQSVYVSSSQINVSGWSLFQETAHLSNLAPDQLHQLQD